MFKTAYGEEIKIGSILQSAKFPDGIKVQCIDIEDGVVVLRSGRKNDYPLRLRQSTLDKSLWTIVDFKNV